MNLFAVGVNHKTAPVDIRERLAIGAEERGPSLKSLSQVARLDEVLLLSTCNRVEIYGAGSMARGDGILAALAKMRGISQRRLQEHCFVNGNEQAARHIFRVTASLESLVVGEPQILGQVKEAYRFAKSHGTLGTVLERCMTMAFRGAKRVRSETLITRGGASVSSVAVDLARRIFGDLSGAKVLVLGAGEMARHAAMHLRSNASDEIVVVNRSAERGRDLAASVGGRYEPWDQLVKQLQRCDIVVGSTGARLPVIDAAMMRSVMRARRYAPMFLIDIAVPRDIAPEVGQLDEVFLYDIDDLRQVLDQNLAHRSEHASVADRVVDEELHAFLNWTRERNAGPVIRALRERTRAVVDAEVARVLARVPDLDPSARTLIAEKLGHGIVNKLLHQPQTKMRLDLSHADPKRRSLTDATVELFGLEDVKSSSDS